MNVRTWQRSLLIGVCLVALVIPQGRSVQRAFAASPTSTQTPSLQPAQTSAPKTPQIVSSKKVPPGRSWSGALWHVLFDEARTHKPVAAATIAIIVLIFSWSVLLWAYPLGLLAILRRSDIGEFTLWGLKFRALEYALLLPFFAYRERVLNAWLDDCLPHARKFFQEREIQSGREVWVDLPVSLNREVIPELLPVRLKSIFQRASAQILIHGEGGAGKTSLACHIANWAFAENRELRLRPHCMLPLLIEYNFIQNAQTDDILDPLLGELERVSGKNREDLPKRFQVELFSKGRLLIIVDGLSERNEAVREFLTARAGVFPLQCAMFTSRTAEKDVLAQITVVRIEPLRLQGYVLELFIRSYLNAVGYPARFTKREVRNICERLSDVAGDRNITALLATIYTRSEVRRKIGQTQPDDPQNIPALIFSYIREISERAGFKTIFVEEIMKAVECVSWECLRKDFRPVPVKQARLEEAIALMNLPSNADEAKLREVIPQARATLADLDHKLRLLQATSGGREFRPALDPLAEYMAASYLIGLYGKDEQKWRGLLTEIDQVLTKRKPEEIRGFLLALRDCANLEQGVPTWLSSILVERAQYDIRAQTESNRRRRLGYLVHRVEEGDIEEKSASISEIESGGYIDADAEVVLAHVAANGIGPALRAQALGALRWLDVHGGDAQRALIKAMTDADPRVRWSAAASSSIAGPDPRAQMEVLLPLARDPDSEVREAAARYLGRLEHAGAEDELQRLAENDPDQRVRLSAAKAWAALIPGRDSLCALLKAVGSTEDMEEYKLTRYAVLFREHAIECLANRMSASEREVRIVCLRLLISGGEKPPADIVERVEARLGDDDPDVALWAAVALSNWNVAPAHVSALLKKLSMSHSSALRKSALGLLARTPPDDHVLKLLADALSDSDEGVQLGAAAGLFAQDSKNTRALGVLRKLTNSAIPQIRLDLAEDLQRGSMRDLRGADVGELVLRLLVDDSAEVRQKAADIILMRKEPDLLAALAKRIDDPSSNLRCQAAEAFGDLEVADDLEFAPLRQLLQDTDFTVQLTAAESYWKRTKQGAEVLPVLRDFQSEGFGVGSRVFELLAEMGKAGQTDAGLIQLGLQGADRFTRDQAMKALNASGLLDARLTEIVIKLLDDPYENVQAEAIEYLFRADIFEPTVRARMVDIARKAFNPYAKRNALEAMGEMTDLSDAEISVLTEATANADAAIRRMAAASIFSARVPAKRAIPSLVPLLSDKNGLTATFVRDRFERAFQSRQFPLMLLAEAAVADTSARVSLLRIIETSETVDEASVPALTKLFTDPVPRVGQIAARLIGRSGTTDAGNLAALESAMYLWGVRRVALLAYERLVPRSSAAERAAAELLNSGDARLHLAAAIVLSVHENAVAQATVEEALSSEDSKLQHAVLEALRDLPAARDLFYPKIEPLLQSSDLMTRRYSAELLLEGQSSDKAIETLGTLLLQYQPVTEILRRAGKKAVTAVPEVQKAVEQGIESAIPLLCSLAPPGLAMQSLQLALSQNKANIRAAAAAAIGEIGQAPENVIRQLQTLSHDADRDVRIAARASLIRLAVTTH
jgi:HEAT repeat protein/GTPase SAR1 family protein